MSDSILKTFDMQELVNSNNHNIKKELDNALKNFGFIAVTNHGISLNLFNELYGKLKLFFNLGLEFKNKYISPDANKMDSGYLPIGIESVSSTLGKLQPHDLCEALVFSYKKDKIANIYPKEIDTLDYLVEEYKSKIDHLARKIIEVFSSVLEVDKVNLLKLFIPPRLNLRFVNYPAQDKLNILPGQLRYGAHQDYGMITILKPDCDVSGLQVCDSSGIWHDIIVRNEELVINCGDLLSYYTGNRWRSALHRVVNPPEGINAKFSRLSMVAFYDPDIDSIIDPIFPDISGVKNNPVNSGDYINMKLLKSMEF